MLTLLPTLSKSDLTVRIYQGKEPRIQKQKIPRSYRLKST